MPQSFVAYGRSNRESPEASTLEVGGGEAEASAHGTHAYVRTTALPACGGGRDKS